MRSRQQIADDAERQARLRAAESLIRIVDAKDTYTGQHSQSVSRLVEAIGRRMQLDEDMLEQLRLAGLLHDLGKIATPDSILRKPGALTSEEQEVLRGHAELGYRLVEGLGVAPVDSWIRHHHEPGTAVATRTISRATTFRSARASSSSPTPSTP